jgi:ketosteroid isomerase-like protein
MKTNEALRFAVEWIAAWNSHDLDRILSHYANDIVLLSAFAEKLVGDGRVVGMAALRSYWAQGLAAQPNLKFDFIEVRVGHQCLTILFRNHRDQQGAETFEFGAGDKVVRSFACYGS